MEESSCRGREGARVGGLTVDREGVWGESTWHEIDGSETLS
jgi:hypothetical protein